MLEVSKGPTGGEISDISEALLDNFVKIANPVGMLLGPGLSIVKAVSIQNFINPSFQNRFSNW